MFAQLGARGVSVIFSSGDTGVGSACQTNDGKNTTRFLPIFPAACPFVTSVGATRYVEPEVAVSFSSGGFSDRFPRPSYQDAAVSAYLEGLGDTFAGLYNPEGRGFPDVAAQGVNFAVFDKGRSVGISGTSASAPAFAGIVADLNSVRLSAGMSPLGFLNPWLYGTASTGFTDIVNGGSTGCTGVDQYSGLTTPIVPNASWKAVSGWDPVTAGLPGTKLGTPTATSEEDVASQFLGFFKNFVETFSMQGYTVYVTGESYAGYYVPYIADAMLNKNDTTYYNLSSIMIYDPSLTYDTIQRDIVVVPFVDFWYPLMPLNSSYMDYLHSQQDTCGYTSFLDNYLTYPPAGPLPTPPNANERTSSCNLWRAVYNAAMLVNPCWDVYQVATTCPLLWDVLGFPGSFDYLPAGAQIYFNRPEVKAAINAPTDVDWMECTNTDVFVNDDDQSAPSALSVLPGVIERTERTIIGHGLLDMILLANGTLLAIQNMTWNGAQGFSAPPTDNFFVPYHPRGDEGTLAASGNMGQFRTERGLTYVDITLSGHMVPQYVPSAAYRHLEFLLGRIPSLNSTVPFTTQ
ncbi:MAG: hypothetical protein Q9227_001947 [Pyrenula ochraceoflavens]